MPSYYIKCRRHTGNVGSKKVIIKNKMITYKSRCARCSCKKSEFLKQEHDKKTGWNNIDPKLFIYW